MAAGSGSAAAVVAVGGSGPAGPQAAGATAAGSAPAGSGAPVPGPGAVLIGDRLYSGVLITLENCLLPEHTLRFTPSMSSGLDPDTETELRVTGCELIQAAGILLRLPQVAMATGQVLFQRFFYTKSFVKHSMEHVSMACVHLASKIEEAPRRIRDVINVFHRLRHLREKKKPVPLILDQEYVNLKNQIIKAERRVLKELGFCVHVKHPHKIIVMYLQVLECERNQHLVQTSWVASEARTLEIPLPNRPHWFLLFGATEEEIQEICVKILQLYTRKKVDLSDLERFSPVPKNESPKEVKGNKPSPLPVQAMKNAKRKTEGAKRMSSNSPVNGVQKGRESRSRSGSRDQSYSRSPSRSASPKHRKSESYSTSSGSKSHSRSRSRSDSPPRQFNHSSSYKGSKLETASWLSLIRTSLRLLLCDLPVSGVRT
ncbi:cyclin-L2 [Grus japonensis]|uniref:Cyclin-L2 n=1 Tax=Grus japonensis TaxID=30415 RepID=A0ABC9XMB7_GRUJA